MLDVENQKGGAIRHRLFAFSSAAGREETLRRLAKSASADSRSG
jgi:hypothetical protein